MAWMPNVDITIRANDKNSKLVCIPDITCLHTIAGYSPASAAHFSVRSDGYIWQHRDTTKQSAANLNGNNHIIAIETEDHGPSFGAWSGSDVPGWTSQQVESIAKILVWTHNTHGIPLVQCPNSIRGSRGIAFHRQGIDGNYQNGRIPGGELWSESRGKVCPGDRRIAQMNQVILRAREIAGLGGEDLTPEEHTWLKGLNDVIGSYYVVSKGKAIGTAIWQIEQALGEAFAQTGKGIGSLVVELLNRVEQLEDQLENVGNVDVDESLIAQQIITALVQNGVLTKDQVVEAVRLANQAAWNV